MSSLLDNVTQLKQLHKKLLEQWGDVRISWTDVYAERFDQTHWKPLDQDIRLVIREMESLAKTIEDARRHTGCTG